MRLATILDQIDLGSMALPEFQRGYVWNRDQVRGLMHSLYMRHPVGSLLVWVTKTESASARGDGHLSPGFVKLLLDGQQRITSLYGIVRGKPASRIAHRPKTLAWCYGVHTESTHSEKDGSRTKRASAVHAVLSTCGVQIAGRTCPSWMVRCGGVTVRIANGAQYRNLHRQVISASRSPLGSF